MAGHSAIRRVVMGTARSVRRPDAGKICEQMKDLLRRVHPGGALGFPRPRHSSTTMPTAIRCPSRHATPRGTHELRPSSASSKAPRWKSLPSPAVPEVPYRASHARCPCRQTAGELESTGSSQPAAPMSSPREQRLGATTMRRERGAEVSALTLPQSATSGSISIADSCSMSLPGWGAFLKSSVVNSPPTAAGSRTSRGTANPRARADKAACAVTRRTGPHCGWLGSFSEDNQRLLEPHVGDIAAERAADPFDVLADIALADSLRTQFMPKTLRRG